MSVAHPQENRQVEVTNWTIVKGIKKRLVKLQGSWVDELQHILWSYWTPIQTPTKETSFSLVYGCEVVTPIEVGVHNT